MKTCPKCTRTYPDEAEFCLLDGTGLAAAASGADAHLVVGLGKRFRIIRRLGAGGMGTVFLAEQTGVGNRSVALKVLNRRLLDNPEFLLRFQNEAASTGRIDHPNVVTIYEAAQADDGTPYIAMQFLQGQTLREVLKERGPLPVAECVEILKQTARGLSAAHKLGIIHRDLKPDNIFLTQGEDGELIVKVVDFGIAKLLESAHHTMTGTVLGTPAYMSYEQATGMRSDDLDARSDIYSLGITAYEMLTGQVPFRSETPLGYVRKHMMDEAAPLRTINSGLSAFPQLEAVVTRALAKDREQRYATVLEFARAFAEATQAELAVTQHVAAPTVVPQAPNIISPVPTPLPAPAAALPQPPDAESDGKSPLFEYGTSATTNRTSRVIIPAVVIAGVLVILTVVLATHRTTAPPLPKQGTPAPVATPAPEPNSPSPPRLLTAAGPKEPEGATPPVVDNTEETKNKVKVAVAEGDSHYNAGKYDQALAAYESGLALDPNNNQLQQRIQRARKAKAPVIRNTLKEENHISPEQKEICSKLEYDDSKCSLSPWVKQCIQDSLSAEQCSKNLAVERLRCRDNGRTLEECTKIW